MEPKPRNIHVFNHTCGMEHRELEPEPLGMFRLNPDRGTGLEKRGQPLVLEALYHEDNRCRSRNSRQVIIDTAHRCGQCYDG